MPGGKNVLIVGNSLWRKSILAQCPREVRVDECDSIPSNLDSEIRLIILQLDKVPSDNEYESLRIPGGARWMCCEESFAQNPPLNSNIEFRDLHDLRSVLETRFESPVPDNESSPEDREFRREIEKDVFEERLFDHANRTLKTWEARIKLVSRPQDSGNFDDETFQRHLNYFHHSLSNSFKQLVLDHIPKDDSEQSAGLFLSLYVCESTVLLARRHFVANTRSQYEWPLARASLDMGTQINCHEGLLMALFVSILAGAPEDAIMSAEIDSSETRKIRLLFPFRFMFADDSVDVQYLNQSEQRESLAKVLSKYHAIVEWNDIGFVLIFERKIDSRR